VRLAQARRDQRTQGRLRLLLPDTQRVERVACKHTKRTSKRA
jgi:hypothetical protein